MPRAAVVAAAGEVVEVRIAAVQATAPEVVLVLRVREEQRRHHREILVATLTARVGHPDPTPVTRLAMELRGTRLAVSILIHPRAVRPTVNDGRTYPPPNETVPAEGDWGRSAGIEEPAAVKKACDAWS